MVHHKENRDISKTVTDCSRSPILSLGLLMTNGYSRKAAGQDTDQLKALSKRHLRRGNWSTHWPSTVTSKRAGCPPHCKAAP